MYDFDEGLREKLEFVNQALNQLSLSEVHPILAEPMKYALKGEGKRLRPMICMLSAELAGGNYKQTQNAFLALELIHNGTLIHDDIIDDDLFRRGTPAVQVKFDTNRAVLTGDALLSLGLKYASMTGNPEIVCKLANTALNMVQGVALQTFFRRKLVAENTYLKINYLKSGSLFECASVLGGLTASNETSDHEALEKFGRNFGDAYQIRDDICGIYKETEHDELSRIDLLNGDISLLLIYALESGTISEKDKNLLRMLYLGEKTTVNIVEIQRIYEDAGALEKSIAKMQYFANKGKQNIKRFNKCEAKDNLLHILDRSYNNFNPRSKPEILV